MKIALRRRAYATAGAGNARQQWRERHALTVRLNDERGAVGFGEAAPLPAYSPDTLDSAERALHAVRAAHIEAALDCSDAWVAIDGVAALIPATQPAARFALECAALDLIGRRRGATAPAVLGARPDASRSLASLVGAARDPGLIEAALAAFESGYRCCKIKVGAAGEADAMAAEIDALRALRARLGIAVSLRVDANRALTPARAAQFCAGIEPLGIEMFEEPCTLGPMPIATSIPFALDESLQGVMPGALARVAADRGARYVVLKPMALGGLSHCRALAQAALAGGVVPIVSHSFDGPLAWRASAALALALDTPVAHGLAPHAGLGDWVPEAACVSRGMLRGWQAPGLGVGDRWLG